MTGEYEQIIKQLQQQLSGQQAHISQIEKSLSTGGVVMQVKSELTNEYQNLLEYATNQVHQAQNTFWTILTIALVIAGWLGWHLEKRITKIFDEVGRKETTVTNISNSITNLKKEAEEFIDKTSTTVYDEVIQNMADHRMKRIERNALDRSHLYGNISTLEPKYIRKDEKNYFRVLMDTRERVFKEEEREQITGAIYQFFPDKLFLHKKISMRTYINGITDNQGSSIRFKIISYTDEIIRGTKLILKTYQKNNSNGELNEELQKYLQAIWDNVINGKNVYNEYEKLAVKNHINENIMLGGETAKQIREGICNE